MIWTLLNNCGGYSREIKPKQDDGWNLMLSIRTWSGADFILNIKLQMCPDEEKREGKKGKDHKKWKDYVPHSPPAKWILRNGKSRNVEERPYRDSGPLLLAAKWTLRCQQLWWKGKGCVEKLNKKRGYIFLMIFMPCQINSEELQKKKCRVREAYITGTMTF